MDSKPYILWDWNGTLLDDTAASLAALNNQLRARGLPPVDLAFYRAHFAFPVRPFYAACGLDLAHEDWDRLAQDYHDAYQAQPKSLNVAAREAISYVAAHGDGQSIVSALRQDMLDAITMELGVASAMDFVCGVDNLDGASKLARARELVGTLAKPNRHFVLIGDSLHDKEVADALGIGCVLTGEGSHAVERLRVAAPTGDTLLEAVHLAFAST